MRYVVLEPLSQGGMGLVFLAVRSGDDGAFRRLCALKRIRSEYRANARFRKMFVAEAQIAGLIQHPNVVSVIDVGEDEDGPFLVMDLVDGITVSHLLTQLFANEQRLPVQLALRIVSQCAKGLAAAHELVDRDGTPMQLVHRDISPGNILLGFDGLARLTDFGIARVNGRELRTTTGVLKGKVGYMAPEQLRFEDPQQGSDLWSLGVVMFELLAGKRMFRAEDELALARKILGDEPPDLYDIREDVPPPVTELLLELLCKDMAHRPPSARNVAQRLDQAIEELATIEGTTSLEGFLSEHFQLIRESTELRRSRALAYSSRPPMAGPAADDIPSGSPASQLPRAARAHKAAPVTRVGVAWRAGAAVMALGIAVGLTLWTVRFARSPSASALTGTDSRDPGRDPDRDPDKVAESTGPADQAASGSPTSAAAPDEPFSPSPPVEPSVDGSERPGEATVPGTAAGGGLAVAPENRNAAALRRVSIGRQRARALSRRHGRSEEQVSRNPAADAQRSPVGADHFRAADHLVSF